MNCTYCNAESGDNDTCTMCKGLWSLFDLEIDTIERRYSISRQNAYEAHSKRINTRKHFVSMGIDEHGMYKVSESILVRIHDNWRNAYDLTTDTLFTIIGYSVDGVNLSTQSDPAFSIRITVDDIPHITKVTAEHRYCSKCGNYLELNDDNFYRYANGNFLARCKTCMKGESKDAYKQEKVNRFKKNVGE